MASVKANRAPKTASETVNIEIIDKGKGGYILSKSQPQTRAGFYQEPKKMVFGSGEGAKLIEYLEQNCISTKERAAEEAGEGGKGY